MSLEVKKLSSKQSSHKLKRGKLQDRKKVYNAKTNSNSSIKVTKK
jgi:hypothetical protein